MILWARCPEHTAASQGDLEVSWCVYRSFDLRLSLRLATQRLTPRWPWEQKASGSSLRTGSYFVERNDKAKMLFLTTAKKTTWMLFWMCRIVIVPNNPCLLLWGYEIFLCPICAWLPLISATSVPLFWACSSLFWSATSNSSFLIVSHEGLCLSALHLNASSLLLRAA